MGGWTTVEYRLLGPIEVVVDGARRPLSGHRQELLLAALVLARGCEVQTDQLLELLWDAAPPRHPEAALRSQVARLRRAVGIDAAALTFGVRGYVLRSDGVVDAERFGELANQARSADGPRALEAADAALALWRSTDLAFANRPALGAAAVRLQEMRTALIERRAELLIDGGREAEVIAELRAVVAERPEHEPFRALLIEALHRSGRPTEALAVYRSWRDELGERGLEPAARLRDLERRILCQEVPTPASHIAAGGATPEARARPAPTTSFIGREHDLEQLNRALREDRIVTLIGPGGVGKSRLARELLRRVEPRPAMIDVDLSAVHEGADVTRLAAAAAGVSEATSGRALLDLVVEWIAGRSCVVLLDNCEHVIDEAADLAATIAARAPRSTVLATSQRRLGVAGEWSWPVTPLCTVGADSPAVRLFLDRARDAAPHLAHLADDVARIQRICQAVDGLPFGIEIAAAQTSALSLADLEVELENPLELRASTPRSLRHPTLRAVIEWAYHRLDRRERRVLERLSVFVGPFDLTAARAVLRDVVGGSEVAASIVQLVDRSLVSFQTVDERGHYRMLQGVRAFGLDRLHAHGQLHTARSTHAAWAVELAEQAERDLATDERTVVRQLERCFDDLRAAHHWLVAFDAPNAMRLIHALHPYALWHCRTEVFRWAEVVAALDCSSPLRASVKASVCAGAWIRGDLHAAELAARAALAAVTEPATPLARHAFGQAGEIALQRGDAARAVTMYDRALDLSQRIDDRMQAVWDLGSSALVLGYTGHHVEADRRAAAAAAISKGVASPSARAFTAFVLGEIASTRRPVQARAHLKEALELAGSVDNHFIGALARVTLASLEPEDGADLDAAIQHYTSAIASWEHAGAWFSQLVTLRSIVGLLATNGAIEDAAMLYGAVIAGARAGSPIYGSDHTKMARTWMAIEHGLGDQQAARLASIGARLSPPEVIALTRRALGNCRPG